MELSLPISMTPYKAFVSNCAHLLAEGRPFPLGTFAPAPRPAIPKDAPNALFFAPHPDDETIVGGLALRIFREARMNLIDVAVTQGSKKERQAGSLREMQAGCEDLGF